MEPAPTKMRFELSRLALVMVFKMNRNLWKPMSRLSLLIAYQRSGYGTLKQLGIVASSKQPFYDLFQKLRHKLLFKLQLREPEMDSTIQRQFGSIPSN